MTAFETTNFDKYLIHDVTLWDGSHSQDGVSLLIEAGKVKSIVRAKDVPVDQWPEEQRFLGKKRILMPAGTDPQVHMRVPGQPDKETAATALKAALHGGVAALLTMPNTKPVIDDLASLALAKEEIRIATDQYPVKVLISAALTKGQKGQTVVDFESLFKAGVHHFTDDGVGVARDDIMESIFKASADLGFTVLQHAEVPGHGGILAPSTVQNHLGIRGYDKSAEVDMVARDLRLLKSYPKACYHVLHVSCRETVELVAKAKDQGLQASCEVSPHHLFFSAEDIQSDNSSFKMNPPLRGEEDRAFLVEALQKGLIDFVATDHAPHEATAKTTNFKTAAFGTTGLDTLLPVLWTLMQKGSLSRDRLIEVFAEKPARFLRLETQDGFGKISEGRTLRAVLVENQPEGKAWTTDDLYGLSKNNCFLGSSLQAKISSAFIGRNAFLF